MATRGRTALLTPLAALLAVVAAYAAAPQQALRPGAVGQVGGMLGERLRANTTYLGSADAERLVAMFEKPGSRDWAPVGSQLGLWLEAAITAADATGDPALREKASGILARLLAAQGDDGYLGITDPKLRSVRRPLRAMEAQELAATLDALLAAAELWDSKEALAAAKRLGDFLVATIGPGKAELWPVPNDVTIAGDSSHYGLDATLLSLPMARLARASGAAKYRDWSRWVAESIDRWSVGGTLTNLEKVAAGSLALHQVQAVVPANELHLNLLGLLELHRAAADERLLGIAQAAWREIAASRRYATGAVGVDRRHQGGHHLPNTGTVADATSTASWALLCQRLLEATGDPACADAIERVLWNHLLASQTADGDGWRDCTPLAGWKPEGCFGPLDRTAAGPRFLAMLPGLLYATTPDGAAVNQFVPSTARLELASGAEVTLVTETAYPSDGAIAIAVQPARPARFALHVRLPRWCEQPELKVNGTSVAGELKPGSYARIEREWKPGDRLELTLPMETRWLAGTHGNGGLFCLARGPLVYALDTVWCDAATRRALVADAKGGAIPGLGGIVLDPEAPTGSFEPAPTPAGALGPAFVVRIALADGRRALATMLPFANVGTWYRSPAEQRQRTGRRDAFAVWLPRAPSGRFRTIDIRRFLNVHGNAGRGIFTNAAHADEVVPIARFGVQKLLGVPFELIDPAANGGRNLLVLRGGPPKAIAQRYPGQASVPVGFRCRAIHVLGGVGGWGFPANRDRRDAVHVRIRYDDAPTQTVRWINGDHIADYSTRQDVPGSDHALDAGGRQLRRLRIATNPHSPVTRIEIVDAGSPVAPVVAAITAELPED